MTEFHVEGAIKSSDKKSPRRVIWNIFFALMYPMLMFFAIIITSFISITSFGFNLIVRLIRLFKH